jgi:magnesium transporter
MIKTLKDKITWFDVKYPDEKDIQIVTDAFGLHPLIAEELKGPSGRGKAEFYDSYIFIVIHFPFYDPIRKTSKPIEMDVVASKNKIATIRYEEFPPLEEFMTKCEAIPGFSIHCLGDTPAHFLYRLFEYLYDYAMRELRHINEKITHIEEGIFAGHERQMIRDISYVKRDILDFSRILKPLKIVIESFSLKATRFYGKEFEIYFEDLIRDFNRVEERVENYKDAIESLEATNQALVSSRIDEVMKILSVIAFLLAPFTIVGTLFQINTVFTPIIGSRGDWWIIFGIMLGGSAALWWIFKKKGWL